MEPVKARLQQVLADDFTIEALAQLLQHNPRGLLIARGELAGWVLSFNQYRRGGDERQRWLQAWRALPWRINRATHDEAIVVPRPVLNVTGTMRPGVLPVLLQQGGRYESFEDRILFAYPDPTPYQRPASGVAEPVRRAYTGLVDALYDLPLASRSPVEWAPRVVRLSPDALRAFTQHDADWHRKIDREPSFKGILAKMPSYAARLCLVLHLADVVSGSEPRGVVRPETVEVAWWLGVYFAEHRRRAGCASACT